MQSTMMAMKKKGMSSPRLEQAESTVASVSPPMAKSAATFSRCLSPDLETIHHWAVLTRRKVAGAKRTWLGGQISVGGASPKNFS